MKDGWTPLHYAARNGHIEICTLLINKGADIETQNNVRINDNREHSYKLKEDYSPLDVLFDDYSMYVFV